MNTPGLRFSAGLLALLAATSTATAEVREEWPFNDPRGTQLTQLASITGTGAFNRDGSGIATTGDGLLRIRRTRSGAALYHAPISVEADRPVWLVVEIPSWHLEGEPNEALRFGISHGTAAAEGLADIRMQRIDDTTVHIEGRGHGRGATRIAAQPLFTNPRTDPLTLALEVDPAENRYRIYFRETGGGWMLLGDGLTNRERLPNQVRINVANRFNDSPAEHFDIARMTVTHASPIGRKEVEEVEAVAPELPPPDLSAPPTGVSAMAWAVADATGRIIAGHNVEAPRKNASITKTMCALVVARIADRDPTVLDELVVFSAEAAATRGSSANIEEGESLTVREALYGLMLPSGNDVGNAFAEHFNDRLGPAAPSGATGAAARRNFIAEMNRVAAEIGMTNSHYYIAFGDGGGPDAHTSTAADLIRLAHAAWSHPLVRDTFGTAEYTGTVHHPDGSTRQATWRNTNQLLGQRGFDGIKTGTTRTAGACLLSTAERDGRRLFAVVLGSTARELRFIDTELICNWAWAKLQAEARR